MLVDIHLQLTDYRRSCFYPRHNPAEKRQALSTPYPGWRLQ